jgi:hypothetical protein
VHGLPAVALLGRGHVGQHSLLRYVTNGGPRTPEVTASQESPPVGPPVSDTREELFELNLCANSIQI